MTDLVFPPTAISGEVVDPRSSYVQYDSNNSGGSWWLTDGDWFALELAGWEVDWYVDQVDPWTKKPYPDGRWLGALATAAKKWDTTLGKAIEEWEVVTGQNSSALGCGCCGTPHSFTLNTADGGYVDSYSPSFPYYGERY